MTILRDCAFITRVLFLALLGAAFELTGHGFIRIGTLCFRIGNGLLVPADRLLECACSIEIVED